MHSLLLHHGLHVCNKIAAVVNRTQVTSPSDHYQPWLVFSKRMRTVQFKLTVCLPKTGKLSCICTLLVDS